MDEIARGWPVEPMREAPPALPSIHIDVPLPPEQPISSRVQANPIVNQLHQEVRPEVAQQQKWQPPYQPYHDPYYEPIQHLASIQGEIIPLEEVVLKRSEAIGKLKEQLKALTPELQSLSRSSLSNWVQDARDREV